MAMRTGAAPEAVVISGATATGKSELAVEVAERMGGEIVSADSRQVYRHMDIGTAKPSAALRSRVPHYGLDLLDPEESYSAGRFARDAWRWIPEIRRRGRVPIIVGGTGFFIRALLTPLGPEPEFDPGQRERLRRYLTGLPPAVLKRWLQRLDPTRAEPLRGEGGAQRLARSLEVVLLSGRRHSWWLEQPAQTPALPAAVFCLRLPREELYRRIDRRFDEMMAGGLLDEVRRLLERFPAASPGLRSVGYVELIRHLAGELALAGAVEAAKRSTHRFARRQLTWFRHQLPESTVWLDAGRPSAELAAEIVRQWRQDSDRTGSGAGSRIASCD
jgi:tRNA dimethylallyltransferase